MSHLESGHHLRAGPAGAQSPSTTGQTANLKGSTTTNTVTGTQTAAVPATGFDGNSVIPVVDGSEFWFYTLLSVCLIAAAGAYSGLTVMMLGLDETQVNFMV